MDTPEPGPTGKAAGNPGDGRDAAGNGGSINDLQALCLPGGYRVENQASTKRGDASRPNGVALIREDGSFVETFPQQERRIIETVA